MDGPGYQKPTHQYGASSDFWEGPVGEVPALPETPWDDPETMVRDLKQAIKDIEASGGPA